MRILFISGLIGTAVMHRLIKEGHELKLFIDDPDRKECLDGIVPKTTDWTKELEWVGKEGLIIFDDVTFDGEQDKLRKKGYSVFGGDSRSDRLELDRQFFNDFLGELGVPVLPSFDFHSADEATAYVKNNPGPWVLKQNHHFSMLNYVGQRSDSQDILDMLALYKVNNISPINLQRKVTGVEIGVGRYFNGNDWVGPIEVNFEHKSLCNGDIGPLTAEMGTLMWYEDNEEFPLYQRTLAKLKDYLTEIEYKGDMEINCIVHGENIYPLEATPRFGMPAVDLQCELHTSPWGELLKAIADGKQYDLTYKKSYGIVVTVALPPYPYAPEPFGNSNLFTSTGAGLYFKTDLTDEEIDRIHFEEIAAQTMPDGKVRYFHVGKHGYAFYVTGSGKTVEEAKERAYSVIKKTYIPKMFYRTDIGDKFIREDQEKLRSWGWIA